MSESIEDWSGYCCAERIEKVARTNKSKHNSRFATKESGSELFFAARAHTAWRKTICCPGEAPVSGVEIASRPEYSASHDGMMTTLGSNHRRPPAHNKRWKAGTLGATRELAGLKERKISYPQQGSNFSLRVIAVNQFSKVKEYKKRMYWGSLLAERADTVGDDRITMTEYIQHQEKR